MSCCEPVEEHQIEGVPYFPSERQNYCSEATVQMLMRYLGYEVTQDQVHAAGRDLESLLWWFRMRFPTVTGAPNPTAIRKHLDRGVPVPLMLRLDTGEHKVLATGYRDGGRTFVCHDPDLGPDTDYALGTVVRGNGAVFAYPGRLAGEAPWYFGRVIGMVQTRARAGLRLPE